jgi:predicted transglutaminase-like cysteine proteinase
MSNELWKTLRRIQEELTWAFTYVPDQELWKMREHWETYDELPEPGEPFKGDCDCFAMMARKWCRKLNIPSQLVYCITETGEHHLVLTVEGWILDNRQVGVRSRKDLKYTWLMISGFERNEPWELLFDKN